MVEPFKSKYFPQDGQTAVHRALLQSNTETFVTLVAFGANINILDGKGQSGFDIAMKRKDLHAVKLLCLFGAEVALQDWVLLSGDINGLDKQDQVMLKQILDQNDRLAAINHGYNSSTTKDELLNSITALLTMDKCYQFGTNLHVLKNKIEQLKTSEQLKEMLKPGDQPDQNEKLVSQPIWRFKRNG
ncbi:unnamed protein product [Mytilus edulis]|uniref:Uncharacterized protein n=1 Tax=Mytilus edulis TaxID=6550 RepID=A0A8S3V7X2_MYTED|nr:unnamed protein product [Mytilus edulis]